MKVPHRAGVANHADSLSCVDYRLVAAVQYQAGFLVIRFFGTHAEYDKIAAENVR
jgi:mRNA-degrading endonuclease HigB of HigAB toxin-antitoxin module